MAISKNLSSLLAASAAITLVCSALQSCGGGGSAAGGTTGAGSGGGTNGLATGGIAASVYAATFQVDVKSGNVTIVKNGSPSVRKPGMFTGNSIGFASTQLSNDTLGGTGIRSIQVTLTNNTDIGIGQDTTGYTSGLNIVFGPFDDTTGIVDQRPNTVVSNVTGLGAGFINGPAETAQYRNPAGVAYGSDGSLYIADYGNNRIRELKSGTVSTLAGTGAASEVDGRASLASLNGPYAIAANPVDGALIVADINGNRIRRVTTAGVVETIAGTGTAGGTNGAGNTATFTNPTGVAVDSSGNIYVSEAGSNRVRRVILAGGSPDLSSHYTVSTYAGNATGGHVDGPAASAEFFKPYGLACDSTGNLYVADYDNEMIRMVDTLGNVTTIAGSGTESELDGFGNAATFNHPFGIAFANGALFVTDASGDRVRVVLPEQNGGSGPTSWIVETLAGTTQGDIDGAGNVAEFDSPYGICANRAENLMVADFADGSIHGVAPATGLFSLGTPGVGTAQDPVTLSNPSGYMDGSDFGTAPFLSYAGAIAPGGSSTPMTWQFAIPVGITSFQFQVMAEAGTGQDLPLQSASGAGSPDVDVRTLAGSLTGVAGYLNGPGTDAKFSAIEGVAADALGDVFVSDSGNDVIRRIDPSGNVSTVAGNQSFSDVNGAGNLASFDQPGQIVTNPAGTVLYVTDEVSNSVRRVAFVSGDPTNSANWSVSTIAGNGTSGYVNGAGSAAEFAFPNGIAMSSSGVLYVSEYVGNRIRTVQYVGGDPSQPGSWQVGLLASSTTAASGDTDGQGQNALFDSPFGLCVDGSGNVYVCDPASADIRKIDPSGTVTHFAGNGTAGYQDGVAAGAEFNGANSICVDPAGYFYVSDVNDQHIRRISPGGQVTTVAGTGSSGNADGPGNVATLDFPNGVAVNASGMLYLGTINGYNVRIIQTVVGSASEPRKR